MTSQAASDTIGVLASGGLDSSILIGKLLGERRPVQPFYIRTGLVWQSGELPALRRFLAAVKCDELSELVVLDLPLADLYATQVRALVGDWSAPAEARALIERAGGIDAVDAFLVRHLDERRPLDEAVAAIADRDAAAALAGRFEAGWWWRRRAGVVPKLGGRTLGIDLR